MIRQIVMLIGTAMIVGCAQHGPESARLTPDSQPDHGSQIGESEGQQEDPEFDEFCDLVRDEIFSKSFADFPNPPTFAEEQRKRLAELPTAKAWQLFESGAAALEKEGDRAKAAELFRQVATKYSKTHYAKNSGELAYLLDRMIQEDRHWKSPEDPSKLAVTDQIEYHVHELRNLQAHQDGQPGFCSVLMPRGWAASLRPDKTYNPAKALLAIGGPAIPRLIDMLEDRRPIRAVEYWRSYSPTWHVLRNQDAAIELLNKMLPGEFYQPVNWGSCFSIEPLEVRVKTAAKIRRWWAANKDKSPLARSWSVVDELKIRPAITVLKALGNDPAEKPKVIAKLKEMYEARHSFYRPAFVGLLAELGDRSKLEVTLKEYSQGKYSDHQITLDDELGAGDALGAARNLEEKYGKGQNDK